MKILPIMVLLLSINLQTNIQPLQFFNIPVNRPIIVNTVYEDSYVNNIKNNNPFNIRNNITNNWVGKLPDNTESFEKFTNMEYGIRAGLKLLQNYYTKYNKNTVEKVIYTFAPPNENKTEEYINTICLNTGFSRNQIIDLTNKDTLLKLAKWMVYLEQGIHINPLQEVYDKYFT